MHRQESFPFLSSSRYSIFLCPSLPPSLPLRFPSSPYPIFFSHTIPHSQFFSLPLLSSPTPYFSLLRSFFNLFLFLYFVCVCTKVCASVSLALYLSSSLPSPSQLLKVLIPEAVWVLQSRVEPAVTPALVSLRQLSQGGHSIPSLALSGTGRRG